MSRVERPEFGKEFWNGIIRNLAALIFLGFAYLYRLNNPKGLKAHILQSDHQFSLLITHFSKSNNYSNTVMTIRHIIGFRKKLCGYYRIRIVVIAS
jgi:hypothetical protein